MATTRALKTVYHLLDERNWAAVQAQGLLSTAGLAERSGPEAVARLGLQRLQGEQLACGAYIRDQRPMPPAALDRCLAGGLRAADWYRLLNSRVFFWIDRDRLDRQRRACGSTPQRVLVVDAERMLHVHGQAAAVTPINTGNAMRAAAARNLSTFVPYPRWVRDAWASEHTGGSSRPASHRPVELTVADAVPDILDYIIRME